MKQLFLVAAASICLVANGQKTPSQLLSQGAAFQAYSSHDLEIAQATLLSILAYGTVLSPATILANGAAFQALSDQQLQIAQVTLLNYLGALGGTNTAILRGVSYTNITAAKNAAASGDTIFVNPGTYLENNFLKAGVNYYFYPGARCLYTNTDFSLTSGYAFFDDRATGATTNNIRGAGYFYYSCGTNVDSVTGCHGNSNAVGSVITTNPSTELYLEADTIDGDAFADCICDINGDAASPTMIYLSRARLVTLNLKQLLCSRRLDTLNAIGCNTGGIFWELGETHAHINYISQFPLTFYAVWPHDPTGSSTDNFYISGDVMDGYLYSDSGGPNYRCWYAFNEFKNGMQFLGGKHYVTAQKISGGSSGNTPVAITTASGAEVWITAEKITAPTGNALISMTSASTNHITCQHFEGASGGSNNVFVVTAGLLEVTGGEASVDGAGIIYSGGRTVLKGVTLCTTNKNTLTNFPVIVSAAGFKAVGCTFVGPAACTNAIYASSAQTVNLLACEGNLTNNSNVTLLWTNQFNFSSSVR